MYGPKRIQHELDEAARMVKDRGLRPSDALRAI